MVVLTCTSPGKNTTCCWPSDPQNMTSLNLPSRPSTSGKRAIGEFEDLSIRITKLTNKLTIVL